MRVRWVQQPVHECHVGVNICRTDVVTARRGNAHQQIGALQQSIYMLGLQVQTAFLGADQAVFHHMGNTDPGVHSDYPGCAL